MGFFKKPKAFKTIDTPDFTAPDQISGGNKFNVYNQLKAQRDIDLSTLHTKMDTVANKFKDKIDELTKKYLDTRTIQPYYLLLMQANYFCGTCKFESNSDKLTEIVHKVIRGAFLYGKAGIYFDPSEKVNTFYGVYIVDQKTDLYGETYHAEIGALDIALGQQDGKPLYTNTITLNKDQCKNLIIFNWGIASLSAWVTIWPFVLFQAMLLKMCVAQAFSFNKKFTYKINNPDVVGNEMDAFYDPTNIFLLALNEDDISNKFETIEQTGGNTKDFITYYKEVVSIYYHLYGRKVNVDDKRERNVTTEVNASQENFDIVQSDWLNQFKLFISKINNLENKPSDMDGVTITFIGNEVKSEQEKDDDFSGTNDTDNNSTNVE